VSKQLEDLFPHTIPGFPIEFIEVIRSTPDALASIMESQYFVGGRLTTATRMSLLKIHKMFLLQLSDDEGPRSTRGWPKCHL
jgi:hypothetical protein